MIYNPLISAHEAVPGEPVESGDTPLARLILDLGLDREAATVGNLISDGITDLEVVRARHDEGIVRLFDGVSKLDLMPRLAGQSAARAGDVSTENLRRMLIAMIDDVRVVLIRLAAQLQALRTARERCAEDRQRMANETLQIFAPLANRLGIWQLKWELEDLAFRYLHPEEYHRIAARLAERRVDREHYIDALVGSLGDALSRSGIAAQVHGRPKHIYSIHRKMQRKDLDFDNVFDVRAVRVLVESVADCYSALGIVHTRWRHIAGEFDDYVATPKENNYRSIHTAVIGPDGKIVEVQIRTHSMNRENELGVAAHWRYKEGVRHDEAVDGKVLWLRQLLEWKDDLSDDSELVEHFRSDVFDQRVYVFTPKGKVIDLPGEATPLDFAYAIHTEVGHRCRGAKVNGRIVPLNYRLNNGEQVDVLTVKKGGPGRDWLSPHLGYLHTARARARVARWFKQENFESNMSAGRTALDRELQRLGMSDVRLEKLAQHLEYRKLEDFLAAIGCGDLKLSRAVAVLRDRVEPPDPQAKTRVRRPRHPGRPPDAVQVHGVGNLLTQMASCCRPVPGDEIVGYITRSRGVTIHRRDCRNALRAQAEQWDRLIEVDWGAASPALFPVDVMVRAYDRSGLLHDVTTVISDEGINVLAVELKTDKSEHLAHIRLTMEISDIERLSKVLARIARVPNVSEVRRVSGG